MDLLAEVAEKTSGKGPLVVIIIGGIIILALVMRGKH
jgi:hypothetical protein